MAELDIKMSAYSDVTDYQWLTEGEAAGCLQELAACNAPLHSAVARLRRLLSPERTHLLIEQAELRRRAAAKFSNVERMFFTRTALEQATDEHVARYKATRFTTQRAGARAPSAVADSRPPMIADLCCGIGGDLLGLSELGSVTAVDRNPIAALLAAANLRTLNPDACAFIQTADISDFNMDDIAAWHIDPDRRAAGRRTTSLDACQPSREMIERLLQQVPHAAIKLAPATKVPAAWTECCELEWISRGGECRQLVAWHGDLAQAPGQHRATIIPAARGLALRTLGGTANQPVPLTSRLNQYLFDVDPAVLAAHLKGAVAVEHNLSALSRGPTYLTGPARISDSALQCFQVDEVLPLRVKPLAAYLRERQIGQLEIKKRGVEIAPDKLRRELKLRGDNVATLLITPVAGRPTAILAHRITL